ncbi:hypothetical protein AAFG07_37735 [Bradyrhizobium sp. B097]
MKDVSPGLPPAFNGLEVRPNVQDVIEPDGTSPNRNVLAFGLKAVANF